MGPVEDHADHISQESVETALQAGLEDTCWPSDQAQSACCPRLSKEFLSWSVVQNMPKSCWDQTSSQPLHLKNIEKIKWFWERKRDNLHIDTYRYNPVYSSPTLGRYEKEDDPQSLVDSLFEEKVNAGLWRYHPDFPNKKDWASFCPCKFWTYHIPVPKRMLKKTLNGGFKFNWGSKPSVSEFVFFWN